MPHAAGAIAGLVLAALVLFAALGLAYRQWSDRRRRGDNLAEADAQHFARQDVRRSLGTTLMLVLGIGLGVGAFLMPPGDRREARLFARIWAGNCGLLVLLLILALLDWAATSAYAHRHRRALVQQHREGLKSELRRRSTPTNGRSGPHNGPPSQAP